MSLQSKIDFAVVLKVKNANPNGDPLNGNRPRTTYENLGEISDVCLKRKIRNRLLDDGEKIYVQSDDHKTDSHGSLRERAEATLPSTLSKDDLVKKACQEWYDVRAFGQLFAFKARSKTKAKGAKQAEADGGTDDGVSIPVRGPVSLHPAFSCQPVNVTSTQITKSVSGEGDGTKRQADTMGMKHRVDLGVYVFYGSMSPQLASKTGFSDADAETFKRVLPRMFEGDASSARPEGSMEVLKVVWWKHGSASGQYSSAKVHRSLKIEADGAVSVEPMTGLACEVIDGF